MPTMTDRLLIRSASTPAGREITRQRDRRTIVTMAVRSCLAASPATAAMASKITSCLNAWSLNWPKIWAISNPRKPCHSPRSASAWAICSGATSAGGASHGGPGRYRRLRAPHPRPGPSPGSPLINDPWDRAGDWRRQPAVGISLSSHVQSDPTANSIEKFQPRMRIRLRCYSERLNSCRSKEEFEAHTFELLAESLTCRCCYWRRN